MGELLAMIAAMALVASIVGALFGIDVPGMLANEAVALIEQSVSAG